MKTQLFSVDENNNTITFDLDYLNKTFLRLVKFGELRQQACYSVDDEEDIVIRERVRNALNIIKYPFIAVLGEETFNSQYNRIVPTIEKNVWKQGGTKYRITQRDLLNLCNAISKIAMAQFLDIMVSENGHYSIDTLKVMEENFGYIKRFFPYIKYVDDLFIEDSEFIGEFFSRLEKDMYESEEMAEKTESVFRSIVGYE